MHDIYRTDKLLADIYIYIYAFSRRFYPKRLTIAFRLYIFISTCVPWESNPQPFALLTQCSTMCENDVLFIAPINKWNPISRSDKVLMLVNQSVWFIWDSSAFRVQVACFKLQWLSACVALIICEHVKCFSVAEEDNAIDICNACSARTPGGGKKRQDLTQHILYLTWKIIIAAKLY